MGRYIPNLFFYYVEMSKCLCKQHWWLLTSHSFISSIIEIFVLNTTQEIYYQILTFYQQRKMDIIGIILIGVLVGIAIGIIFICIYFCNNTSTQSHGPLKKIRIKTKFSWYWKWVTKSRSWNSRYSLEYCRKRRITVW